MINQRFKTGLSAMLFTICVSISFAQDIYDEKHVEIALRMIGHEVLLDVGDSTSIVLPIEKEDGVYRISFSSDFSFEPLMMMATIDSVVLDSEIAHSYIVEVEDCNTKEIVYGFEKNNLENKDINACSSRFLPSSCYSLLLTLRGMHEEKASMLNVSPGFSNTSISKTSMFFLFGLIVLISGGTFFYLRKATHEPSNPDLVSLGKYLFDKRNTILKLNNQNIELTAKEANLLMLLHEDANSTVKRDTILQKVWGDEGDYIGRTLDVFISRLRKKLDGDASLKIVNIRGVGYKLVLNSI